MIQHAIPRSERERKKKEEEEATKRHHIVMNRFNFTSAHPKLEMNFSLPPLI